MKNLVLIGMPGSGKSSLGRLLADRLGMKFTDTDGMIEAAEGKTISEIFAQRGEEYFRDLETYWIAEAARGENTVIATGGGAILREENRRALRENGVVFFIDRPPELILKSADLSDRPLLAEDRERIYRLYTQRIGLYLACADCRVLNEGEPALAAERIYSFYKEGGDPK